MLARVISAVAERLLEQSEWARARLAAHAGKRARIELPLAAISLEVTPGGHVSPAHAEGLPDVVIVMAPLAVAKWLVDREAAWREANIEGDTDFAAAISFVAANLRWDFEEDLSRVTGDIAAHRIGQGLRRAAQWPSEAAESGARGVAEYLTEESKILATRLQAESFAEAVDELRDAVERLDKRIERLAARLSESSPH